MLKVTISWKMKDLGRFLLSRLFLTYSIRSQQILLTTLLQFEVMHLASCIICWWWKLKICPLESTVIVDFKNVSHDHVPLQVFCQTDKTSAISWTSISEYRSRRRAIFLRSPLELIIAELKVYSPFCYDTMKKYFNSNLFRHILRFNGPYGPYGGLCDINFLGTENVFPLVILHKHIGPRIRRIKTFLFKRNNSF